MVGRGEEKTDGSSEGRGEGKGRHGGGSEGRRGSKARRTHGRKSIVTEEGMEERCGKKEYKAKRTTDGRRVEHSSICSRQGRIRAKKHSTAKMIESE